MLINLISFIYNEIVMDTDGQVKYFFTNPTPTLCPSYIDLTIKNAIRINFRLNNTNRWEVEVFRHAWGIKAA